MLPKPIKINEQIVDTSTNNGITLTPIVGGKFHIKGTATAKADFFLFRDIAEQLIVEKGDYTISSNNLPSGVLVITSGSGNNGFVYAELSSSNPKVTSSVTDDTKPFNYVVIRIASGTTVNADIYVQLEKGTTATDWEKYTGGIASPNPNYEQPIESAGDNENLVNESNINFIYSSVNKIIYDNGLIKTINSPNGQFYEFDEPLQSGETYTLTFKFVQGRVNVQGSQDFSLGMYHSGNNNSWQGILTKTQIANIDLAGKTFTLTHKATDTITGLYIFIYSSPTFVTPLWFNVKVEKGNKASGYSPYGMGSINEKIINKNFAWNNLGNTTLSGVTFTVNENKSITANGTATKDIYYVLRNDVNFKAGETWALSGCKGGSSTTYRLYCYMLGDLYNGSISHTFQDNFPNRQLGIAIKSGTTLNNVTFYPQLELKQATDYVPPQEQDYSIFVQQPFRSIGDVRDCFVKKSDGKLYERHYIGEKILNGTENWRAYSSNMYLYIEDFILSEGQNNYVPTNYLSDYFTRNSLTNAIANPNASYLIQNVWGERDKQRGVAIRVNDTFTDLATLKTWLTSHNTKLQYELAEPLDLPCTPEQIQQLENLPSTYKDFTIIQSEDETPAYLEVSGIYDLNKIINN